METKAQILAEIKELADKLHSIHAIGGVRWVFINFGKASTLPKSGLIELRDELNKIERAGK